MLQQNWYNEANRYITWVFKNLRKAFNLKELIILLVIISGLYLNDKITLLLYAVVYLIISILYFKVLKQEQSKKPLVVTKRVKRLIVTIIIMYLLPTIIYYIKYKELTNYLKFYQVTTFILIFINFLIIWLANIINIPVEKQVFYYYRRQAVKKLKEMKEIGRASCRERV